MATAHKNFAPPAGTVEVANDPSWKWDGKSWLKNGKKQSPKTGTPLRGKAGTQMAGWYYDWPKKAWIQPDQALAPRPTPPRAPPPVARPGMPRPPILTRPAPTPMIPNKENPTMTTQQTCTHLAHREPDVYEQLKRHPLFPLLGLGLSVASDLLTAPQPPQFPEGLPEATRAMWQMIYAQNVALYQARKAILDKYATLLLGFTGANAVAAELARHADQKAA